MAEISNRRRMTLVIASVIAGTLLSAGIIKMRRGSSGFAGDDYLTLVTNLVFSLAIILGIGFLFIWRKKKDL